MKHQRVYTDPLARITGPTHPGDGIPSTWDDTTGDLPTLPTDQAWVPITDRPSYDPDTQRVVKATITLESDGWTVEDLTDAQIAANVDRLASQAEQRAQQQVQEKLLKEKHDEEIVRVQALPDSEAIEEVILFPAFRVGKLYDTIGEKFQHKGQLYKTNIVFTGAAHQLPGMDGLDALFTRIPFPGEVLPWTQPQGAHDAPGIGAIRSHEGQTWRSTVDANVYAPGVVPGEWVVVEEPVI